MYLIYIKWIGSDTYTFCQICESEVIAREWLDKELEGKLLSGMGIYKIEYVPFYK